MSTSPKLYVRSAAALLALAALFAYGPSPAAQAEPASSRDEARAVAGVEANGENAETPALPGPEDEGSSENDAEEDKPGERPAPPSKKLMLTIPRLGLENVKVGDSPDQSYLDREGIMHLSGTGFPYQKDSNTYIAAHAIGYAGSRVTYAFRDLEDMKKGDRVTVRDASGKTYQYRVYEKMIVDPDDFWVTKPVEGKKIISLQTCWPEPSFEKRLIVRAEIVRK
ncbi:sortase [Rubrobacter marinus]|uniref:Sortase n=1 Tax=Rubrobacter marinus TaxID=2653852 RepID=A0A6G8Q1Y1_9ACTN|nr:class E sortase [Rubrobacter marinus]QIN80420.1 sortase [Rubrobacter marinus]